MSTVSPKRHLVPVPDVPDLVAPLPSLAREAASQAAAFAERLAAIYETIAAGIRAGQDVDALDVLAQSVDEMEYFLQFLILVGDHLGDNTTVLEKLQGYREELVEILEGLQPALGHVDLVEIADALEDDLVPSLRLYEEELNASIMAAIAA